MLAIPDASLPSALVTRKFRSLFPTIPTNRPIAVVETLASPPTAYSSKGNSPKSGNGNSNSVTTVFAAGPPPARSAFVLTNCQASADKARVCNALIIWGASSVSLG